MKRYMVIFLVGLLSVAGMSDATAQKPTCEGNSYAAEIISKKVLSGTCTEYEIKVSYDGSRTFGLSHFTLGIPCGEVKDISNSENWKQVFGKDPTTGVYGLKIDDISGFGENGADSFTVKFTWCSDGSCDKKLGSVAYKAGQCIDYQTLQDNSVVSGGGTSDQGDKEDKGGGNKGDNCGNPAHDHGKDSSDKDGSCGNGGGTGSDSDGDDTGGGTNDGGDGAGGNPEQKPTCDGNSFSSEIISKKVISETCVEYEVVVSYDGSRTFGLSHFTIGIPCGDVKDISNSENWKQVFGKDPTTGVYGLKIDDINGFGENGADSFTVKFTWCSDGSCNNVLGTVAYKAGLCIDYDSLQDNSGGNSDDTSDQDDDGSIGDGGTNSDDTGTGDTDGDGTTDGGSNGDTGGGTTTDGGDTGTGGTDGGGTTDGGSTGDGGTSGGDSGTGTDGTVGGTDGGTTGDGGTTDGTDDGGTTSDGGGTDTGADNPSDSTNTNTTCSTLIAKLQKTNLICFGGSNGQLQAVVTDGEEPYTFAWSTGDTTSSIMNLSAGVYNVTVTDANGNTMTLTETITAPEPIAITESIINPSCSGFFNGSISLHVAGGSGAYTFAWSNGSTQQNLLSLGSGSYTVSVTDGAGCSSQKTFTLINTSAITAGVSFTHPGCGQSNGIIDITPAGGVAPYTYLWSTGATTQDLQNGTPGTYNVKITDATGCSVNMVYALRINNTMSLKYIVTPTTCVDNGSGAINLSVTGGTAPYTYLWQDGITTEDRSALTARLYKVTVTDAAGCSSSITISVYKKTFQVTSDVIQPTCAGDTGSVTVAPVDGVAPYTYAWSNGETDNSIDGVSGGTYSVTITDASGCSVTMVYAMPSLLAISATSAVSNMQCGSEGAYAIDLSVSGGKSPYSYVWSNGAISEDISGLNSGTYSVQITDANGCRVTQEIIVNPVSVSWACLINQPVGEVVCTSAGNKLSTSVLDATTYQWTVSSSDNSWVITAGANTSSVVYTAGNKGTSSTFTLTITRDGCTKTCLYTISATGCIEKDNTGGGDPMSGDPCASADTTAMTTTTNTTDSTRVAATSTPAETTAATSTIDQQAEQPEQTMEEAQPETFEESLSAEFSVSAYPNPFMDEINFEWTAPVDDYVSIEVFDALGRRASEVFSGNVRKGQSYKFNWIPTGTDKIYFYKCSSSKKTNQGKLFRK